MSCVFHVAGEESLAKKEKSISDFEMERRRWGYDAVSRSTLVERSTPRQPRPLQGPAYLIERDSLVAPSAARERETQRISVVSTTCMAFCIGNSLSLSLY